MAFKKLNEENLNLVRKWIKEEGAVWAYDSTTKSMMGRWGQKIRQGEVVE